MIGEILSMIKSGDKVVYINKIKENAEFKKKFSEATLISIFKSVESTLSPKQYIDYIIYSTEKLGSLIYEELITKDDVKISTLQHWVDCISCRLFTPLQIQLKTTLNPNNIVVEFQEMWHLKNIYQNYKFIYAYIYGLFRGLWKKYAPEGSVDVRDFEIKSGKCKLILDVKMPDTYEKVVDKIMNL